MKARLMIGVAAAIVGAPLAAQTANPLLAPWTGPYGGTPAFDKVRVADFVPAMDVAIAETLREIDAIANNPAPPTFENTIVAMERSGAALSRGGALFGVWSGNLKTADFQKVETEVFPKYAALGDRITQNAALFARVDAVYNSPDKAKLTPEQQRLTWVVWNRFAQQGAKLTPAQKIEFSANNQKLAGLYAKFAQNQLADEESLFLTLDSAAQLKGLPKAQVDAAAAEAVKRGVPGKWVISNTRSSMEPFLTYADDRAAREKGFRLWTSRGDGGGSTDNNALVTQILALRAAQAKLIGYPTFAHWTLADRMAKNPETALALSLQAWKPAVEQVRKDVAVMQAVVDADKGGFKIAPWDYRYYAEKVRKAKYDLDLNEVKPYLQLDNIRKAMFWVAEKNYGLTFTQVNDVTVFHPDVTVWKVTRGGKHVGLWYFDPFARAGKNSGAWMSAYREQSRYDGEVPTIVSNNSNFIKAPEGQPTTISFDDARTMFHEFGHALHGLNSNVTYPTVSGTNTVRDFVEFPSQIHEHFFDTAEVRKFFVNAKGEPLPPALIKKIEAANLFNLAFSVVEAQASALIDMKLHLAGASPIDPKAFEKTTLAELGMPSEIVMRHRIPAFGHIFAGEGYAAGYYGYLWAEVLDNDAFEAFTEAGSAFDPQVAKRFHDTIMSVGNTVDPATAFRNFRGRDPKVDAWLRDKGFAPAATAQSRSGAPSGK
ncbi:M3 family metallopeptidase [Glacieibacterium frigidum]|uniref:M3 family metallopeptidase n=1 Tax=Glacieibacterium frigidum TaxID=2593303 RepID=A0A552UFE5_9SPHN|nr:M3 family metallopeptidase [Glacieibacterium frigidum]TRW16942.1 M3 family metallopeptidase [Glacieibacterium frigidum]